jgi:serine/threonine protein kinase
MKALLELGGRSPGGTRRRWGTAGEGHPTVPEQLAGRWPGEPGGHLVAGRFRLRSLLGRGGMGRVWLANDELLDRPVAVKQLLLHGLEPAEMRAQAWVCALREARAAARVDHTGVVRIYDIVQEKGCPWIVMEPLSGRTLQQALNAAGPLPVRQVTRVGLRLVDVLQATHRAGIVHRDVTPGNVHLCGGGRVVLTDFGIACTTDDASPAAGTFSGTPAYISPERLDGGDFGPACDLFSLGATLFTAVEGKPPFDRGSLVATLTAVLVDGPAPFLRAGPLRPVIEGLLAKDPGRRLSAAQARAALRAIQREHDTAQVQTSWIYASPAASAPFRRRQALTRTVTCRVALAAMPGLPLSGSRDGRSPGRRAPSRCEIVSGGKRSVSFRGDIEANLISQFTVPRPAFTAEAEGMTHALRNPRWR